MIIEKVLNNNVIITIDKDTGLEKVVTGRGIAFKKKKGEKIDESKIEKIFQIQNENENIKFQKLFNEIPLEHIEISEKIISYAKQKLNVDLNERIYIALTDHISFAIERVLSNVEIHNPLLWEIKRLYKEEYKIGKWAIDLIEKELKVKMPDDEAGFIALHIRNATIDEKMENTMDITRMVQDILDIIEDYLDIEIPESNISYDRLITHLKFFAKRVISKKQIKEDDNTILGIIKENYKYAYTCALKIKNYVEASYDYKLRDEEIAYLSLHIKRIMSSLKK
ncbi:BglG family transcription antiterminator LicT [Tepidibacter formicigenes]|jgi:beta-glucoside operon transcriptional antiterminator|uniref:Transcriptional antiterminator, BglG family n=1 Tax=Tepidibacter formicigenes DSM 15518 TaxID=1123349 RepID=A0A1M6LCW1_9FIRM|nr:PRD domain-containing protein [Tepidibacter formicigenes]SHJ69043.1 transcriptional antiterminator, BglG family [Tepidibacter formicigenes DSM 15518]